MEEDRVRISDVADALGVSSATVSNVIHGKTNKMSERTLKRVQQELEDSGYIPNMAGILLAQNTSRIIGFDDSEASRESRPALTTIHQDAVLRAETALNCIEALRDGKACDSRIVLPVTIIERESTGRK